MSDDYPLKGDGIEIRKSREQSTDGRRKYTISVHPDLYNQFVAVHQKQEDPKREDPKDSDGSETPREPLTTSPDTGWRLIGYVVTEDGFEPAAGDEPCT